MNVARWSVVPALLCLMAGWGCDDDDARNLTDDGGGVWDVVVATDDGQVGDDETAEDLAPEPGDEGGGDMPADPLGEVPQTDTPGDTWQDSVPEVDHGVTDTPSDEDPGQDSFDTAGDPGDTDFNPPLDVSLDEGGETFVPQCVDDGDCDDGLVCTANTCQSGLCVTQAKYVCAWPAEQMLFAQNLTSIEGGAFDNDFHKDLSGAVWNPQAEMLWVCTNNGPSRVWAVSPDGTQSFKIDYKGGNRGEWVDFGDLEGLTLASLDEPETLYLMIEGGGRIREYDLSTYGVAVMKNDWDTSPQLGGTGAEGITFVPDGFLEAQGFVGPDGQPVSSQNGMGGLMLVGHQGDGAIHAFDLDRADGTYDYVGKYFTDRDETAGLEFDRSTGLLFIWHGGDHNMLEQAWLSTTPTPQGRRFDAVRIMEGPGPILFGSTNYEGIAVMSNDDCFEGLRGFFLTIDGGGTHSLIWFKEFPCE